MTECQSVLSSNGHYETHCDDPGASLDRFFSGLLIIMIVAFTYAFWKRK